MKPLTRDKVYALPEGAMIFYMYLDTKSLKRATVINHMKSLYYDTPLGIEVQHQDGEKADILLYGVEKGNALVWLDDIEEETTNE